MFTNYKSTHNAKIGISAFIGALLLLSMTTAGTGQPLFNSYLIHNSVGPRSGALAYSNVADAWSSGSMYTNPAAPLFARYKATVESSIYFEDNNAALSRVLIPLIAGNGNNFTTGITYRRPKSHSLAIKPQTRIPQSDYFRMDFGYSFKISNTVGAGVMSGLSMNPSLNNETYSLIQAAGLYYSPTPALNYGIVYKGSFQELYQPLSGTDSTKKIHPHHVEIGLSLKYPTGIKEPFLRISVSNLKIIRKDGLWYKGGIEVWPYEETALRLGYASGPSADRFSSGLGLMFGNIMLDYSFGIFRRSNFQNYINQIGISINIR